MITAGTGEITRPFGKIKIFILNGRWFLRLVRAKPYLEGATAAGGAGGLPAAGETMGR
jgi:hypothetical protein